VNSLQEGSPTGAPDPQVSIAIPCYEMNGRGGECLEFALSTIAVQSYPHIEVVVADHSLDHDLEEICDRWSETLDLRYWRNSHKRGSSSANTNVAMSRCHGDLIKILCQDDYLSDNQAISRTVAAFKSSTTWLVSSYRHTADRSVLVDRHDPTMNADIQLMNTIGTHSCLTLRRMPNLEWFDERLIWYMDCEYYRRLYDRFGAPTILREVTVIQMVWSGQVTNTLASSRKLVRDEKKIVRHKHPDPIPGLKRGEVAGSWPASRLRRVVRRLERRRGPRVSGH
jgi:glycosyltransferase involved in cell wall biosynthesis